MGRAGPNKSNMQMLRALRDRPYRTQYQVAALAKRLLGLDPWQANDIYVSLRMGGWLVGLEASDNPRWYRLAPKALKWLQMDDLVQAKSVSTYEDAGVAGV